jgi:hypothetical protein
MSRRIAVAASLLGVALALGPVVANAQTRPTLAGLAEQLATLQADVELFKQSAAQVETISQAVQDFDARIEVLTQQLATLQRQQKSIPDAITQLDAVSGRLIAVEQDVARLRAKVADLERGGATVQGGVTHANRFRLTTDDGAYSLGIHGFGQIRGQVATVEGGDTFDESFLEVQRARLGVNGQLGSDALEYAILIDAIQSPSLFDFYLDYRVWNFVSVKAGQYKVPFVRNFITDSPWLAFPQRPAAVESYRYDREVQVGAHGSVLADRLVFYVGAGNGAGRAKTNDNIDYLFVGQVEYGILGPVLSYEEGDLAGTAKPALVVGGAVVHDLVTIPDELGGVSVGQRDVDGDGDLDNVRVVSTNLSAVFRYLGASVTAEWLLRWEDWGTILDHGDNVALRAALDDLGIIGSSRVYQAGYGQATYMVLPQRLMVGGRLGYSRNTLLGVSGRHASSQPLGSRLFEGNLLLQLYDQRFSGRALGLMYSFFNFEGRNEPADDKVHRLILETQLRF